MSKFSFTGKLKPDVVFGADGKPQITFVINEKKYVLQMVDELRDVEKLAIEVDKFRKKRSLNANNYAWHLLNEIGNVTRESKEEVYIRLLKSYGQVWQISFPAEVPVLDFVKYGEEIGESVENGVKMKHYRAYKGSSEFDTREMSIFLDGVISEAENLGIQTMTPNEIANLKSLWRNGNA